MIYLFEMMIFPVRYVNYPECNIFFGVKPDHMALDTTMVGFGLVVLSSIMLRPSPHQHTSWCCSRHRRYKDSTLGMNVEVRHGKTSNLSLVLVAIIYIELKHVYQSFHVIQPRKWYVYPTILWNILRDIHGIWPTTWGDKVDAAVFLASLIGNWWSSPGFSGTILSDKSTRVSLASELNPLTILSPCESRSRQGMGGMDRTSKNIYQASDYLPRKVNE